MLPKQVTDLTDVHVKAFDSEFPPSREVHDAHQRAAGQLVASGFGVNGRLLIMYARQIEPYLEKRAALVRDKLKEAVSVTELEPYSELAADLKTQLDQYMTPANQAAHSQFENIRQSFKLDKTSTEHFKVEMGKMLPRIKAELETFAVQHTTNMNKKAQMAGDVKITYNVSGDNARVVIGSHDYSINIANSKNIFSELTKTITENIEDPQKRSELVAKTSELEQNIGKKSAFKTYAELVELASNHMNLIGPYIPALTKLVSDAFS